jgi:hypothetical protein
MIIPAPYEWISWLGERNAQVLLISLMAAIEEGTSLETPRRMVEGWRANAQKALTADDYRACVDKYLEVSVDARLYLLRTGHIPLENHDDEPGQL